MNIQKYTQKSIEALQKAQNYDVLHLRRFTKQ